MLSPEQLKLALDNQRRTDMKLGQFLVQGGGISESQLAGVISQQLDIDRYSPEKYPLDEKLSEIIPVDFVRRYQSVAVKKNGHLLTIAMVDPMDIVSLDAIENYTNCEVETIICTEQELNFLTTSLYGTDTGIGEVLENVNEMQYRSESEGVEGLDTTEDIDVNSLQSMAEEAPVVRLVNQVISQAVREGASDIHISPEKNAVQVRFRVDGKLHNVPAPPKYMILPIVSRIKILANMDISLSRVPQDGRFTVRMNQKEINIRTSVIPTIYGENLVLRLLDTSAGIYDLRQLGISDDDRNRIESTIVKPFGMILSTGPTGSGKTTTLYSILKKINHPDVNIITLEDPVEYRIERIRQTQLNEKAGMTFASGIRSILRQDPDVIMVGEIRDSETANIAVQAALTGHRVLSTIHTNNAAGAITRLIDMNVDPFLISSVLLVSIGQRLVRKVCSYCKQPYTPPLSAMKYWGMEEQAGEANFVQSKGCFNCLNLGYKGRTGVYEVLVIDEMVQDMIIDNKSALAITRAVREAGKLRTLKENAAEKILSGETTLDEAASAIMA